jgi:ferritin-like protein
LIIGREGRWLIELNKLIELIIEVGSIEFINEYQYTVLVTR